MDERTENRPLSGSTALRARDVLVALLAAAAVGVVFGFFSQSVAIGAVVAGLVAVISLAWTWRARRSGVDDEQTRATTRQAIDERRTHPEYGPLRQPGTFGIRVGSGAAGKDNGRG